MVIVLLEYIDHMPRISSITEIGCVKLLDFKSNKPDKPNDWPIVALSKTPHQICIPLA